MTIHHLVEEFSKRANACTAPGDLFALTEATVDAPTYLTLERTIETPET